MLNYYQILSGDKIFNSIKNYKYKKIHVKI